MYSDNTILVRYLDIEEVSDHEFQTILTQMGGWNVQENIWVDKKAYKRHILGRWVVFNLLKIYGVTFGDIKNIKLTPFGKPYIPGHKISFNISHSENLIICAVVNQGHVGIDIEYFRPVDCSVYKSCFSVTEWQSISLTDNPNIELLKVWAKKESLLKADGRGLQVDLNKVVVEGECGTILGEEKKWYLTKIPFNGYACYVCTDLPIINLEIDLG